MLISYDTYKELQFDSVDEREFKRFLTMAEGTVERFTFGRVNARNITDRGKYGVCELIEIFASESRNEQRGGRLSGFSNEGYSESYSVSDKLTRPLAVRLEEIMIIYFGRSETWRGVGE